MPVTVVLTIVEKIIFVPDIMVGDFDSATNENYMYFKNMGVEEIKFPTHKDMTDMEIGMDLVLKYRC